MSGNTPNISQDTLDAVKNYSKVTLQQGVPIVDSDWNELQDIAFVRMIQQNMVTFGDCRLAPGPSSKTPGFVCVGDGSENNFMVTPGLACVKGVVVPSEHDTTEPSSSIWYDSIDNYMMNGSVTGVGSGNIVDENTRFELHMDVVGCRVRMTSGSEIGNVFTISGRIDETTLQLNGGTGSIATGDQYLMLPQVLTTPGATRVDEVYIQTWFDDINSDEDTDLLNPALNMEPSHRNKIRSVVRVAEGGTTPATPDPMSLGVRYMRIAKINRSASAVIYAFEVVPEANAAHKLGLGSGDVELEEPQLLWRSLGWKDDVEVVANTHSVYMWGSRLIILRGAYISSGRIWTGAETASPIWMTSDGQVYSAGSTPAGTDMGWYYSYATWSSQYVFGAENFSVRGGDLSIHSGLLMNDGAEIQLGDGAHIVGDPDAETAALPLFKMEVGLALQVHYTDKEVWWMVNTTYDRSTGEFASAGGGFSYMMRYSGDALRVMYHGFSPIPWLIGEWTDHTGLGQSSASANDYEFTRPMLTYAVEQEMTFNRRPGFLVIRLEHSTQGRHVALFRTEDNDSIFELVSGNSGYFDAQYGHPATVNVYPSGSTQFLIQNRVTQPVDIGYGYLRFWDS